MVATTGQKIQESAEKAGAEIKQKSTEVKDAVIDAVHKATAPAEPTLAEKVKSIITGPPK
jgi:hypothetical protein